MPNEYCEIVESVVHVASSTPATDVILICVSQVRASDAHLVGMTLPRVTSTADVSSTAEVEGFNALISRVNVSSSLASSLASDISVQSTVRMVSSVRSVLQELAVSSVEVTSTVNEGAPDVLAVSTANVESSLTVGTAALATLTSRVNVVSSVRGLGILETVASTAHAASNITISRTASVSVASAVEVSSEILTSSKPPPLFVTSTAHVASLVLELQLAAQQAVTTFVDVESDVRYDDAERKAWLMNTETGAVSWYDNFGFDSVASADGVELAAGPGGIYRLDGNTDDGRPIRAQVRTGFIDFGASQSKRMDTMHLGHVGAGAIKVTYEVEGSGHRPYTYTIEPRPSNAPRNSRVTPGKGLRGRYWRYTFANADGGDFEILDISQDVAVSDRRI